MTGFVITKGLRDALLEHLYGQPYGEVEELVGYLRQAPAVDVTGVGEDDEPEDDDGDQ